GEICPALAKLVSSAGPGSRSTIVTSKPARDRYHALLTPITPLPRTSTCIAFEFLRDPIRSSLDTDQHGLTALVRFDSLLSVSKSSRTSRQTQPCALPLTRRDRIPASRRTAGPCATCPPPGACTRPCRR